MFGLARVLINPTRSLVPLIGWMYGCQSNRKSLDVEDSCCRSMSTLNFAFYEFPIGSLCWFLTFYK